jgi:hypothetical protein
MRPERPETFFLEHSPDETRYSAVPLARDQEISTFGWPRTSIFGDTPSPGAVEAAMRPFRLRGAPSAVLTVTHRIAHVNLTSWGASASCLALRTVPSPGPVRVELRRAPAARAGWRPVGPGGNESRLGVPMAASLRPRPAA